MLLRFRRPGGGVVEKKKNLYKCMKIQGITNSFLVKKTYSQKEREKKIQILLLFSSMAFF